MAQGIGAVVAVAGRAGTYGCTERMVAQVPEVLSGADTAFTPGKTGVKQGGSSSGCDTAQDGDCLPGGRSFQTEMILPCWDERSGGRIPYIRWWFNVIALLKIRGDGFCQSRCRAFPVHTDKGRNEIMKGVMVQVCLFF